MKRFIAAAAILFVAGFGYFTPGSSGWKWDVLKSRNTHSHYLAGWAWDDNLQMDVWVDDPPPTTDPPPATDPPTG